MLRGKHGGYLTVYLEDTLFQDQVPELLGYQVVVHMHFEVFPELALLVE
jgi:hypothetical protein